MWTIKEAKLGWQHLDILAFLLVRGPSVTERVASRPKVTSEPTLERLKDLKQSKFVEGSHKTEWAAAEWLKIMFNETKKY